MSEPILSVKNLGIRFAVRGQEVVAVDQLSFDLERGESLGIVGESGSGKSVSCNALLGLLPVPPAKITSGEAWYADTNLLDIGERALQHIRGREISMDSQDPMTSLTPYMRIGEQVMEP
ncbi:MAG: ATP-binding cassette domain-containing protein, partial [Gammaproteobacteria bacterium]